MNLIDETAFSIVTKPEFVYYISRNKENYHDRFYKTDLESTIEVDPQEYTEVKFGNAWRSIHSAYAECIHITGEEFLTCHFESSVIYRHNSEGKKVHHYDIAPISTGFDTIYSITIDKHDHLWLAQPSSHYIGQYDLKTELELFSLGGDYDNPTIFNHPEQVRAYGDYVYISDMGNHRICKIDVYTKQLEEYLKFEEPAWEYAQFKGVEFVRLQSGLYVV
jgi:streptogramin lyase